MPNDHIGGVEGASLATTYQALGRSEEALQMDRDVYSGRVKLSGEEHEDTIVAALNYASSLVGLQRFEDIKALLRKLLPVARRVLGESHDLTLRMRINYAMALYVDTSATLDDIREAVTTLEDTTRIGRRVLGGAHPLLEAFELALQEARRVLRTRETGRRGTIVY